MQINEWEQVNALFLRQIDSFLMFLERSARVA